MIKLYVARKFTGVTLHEDARYPGMWRVHSADGEVSDMVNLSRAKDAAIIFGCPGGRRGMDVNWKHA
jgi:hypothetical protein